MVDRIKRQRGEAKESDTLNLAPLILRLPRDLLSAAFGYLDVAHLRWLHAVSTTCRQFVLRYIRRAPMLLYQGREGEMQILLSLLSCAQRLEHLQLDKVNLTGPVELALALNLVQRNRATLRVLTGSYWPLEMHHAVAQCPKLERYDFGFDDRNRKRPSGSEYGEALVSPCFGPKKKNQNAYKNGWANNRWPLLNIVCIFRNSV